MNWLILTQDQVSAIDAINASHSDRKINYLTIEDGVVVTSADPLRYDYWKDWHEVLSSLQSFQGTSEILNPPKVNLASKKSPKPVDAPAQ
jgi:hypothetical protein